LLETLLLTLGKEVLGESQLRSSLAQYASPSSPIKTRLDSKDGLLEKARIEADKVHLGRLTDLALVILDKAPNADKLRPQLVGLTGEIAAVEDKCSNVKIPGP